jgi:hypothetical protein
MSKRRDLVAGPEGSGETALLDALYRRLRDDRLELAVIDGVGSDQDGSFGSFQSPGFRIGFGKGQRKTPRAAAKRRNPATGLAP